MKKLKYSDIAHFLPYKLYVFDAIAERKKVLNTGQGASGNWVGINTVLWYGNIYKPILQPLTNLRLEPHTFKLMDLLDTNHPQYFTDALIEQNKFVLDYRTYAKVYQYLLKNHFDIGGLIKQRLAVDVGEL